MSIALTRKMNTTTGNYSQNYFYECNECNKIFELLRSLSKIVLFFLCFTAVKKKLFYCTTMTLVQQKWANITCYLNVIPLLQVYTPVLSEQTRPSVIRTSRFYIQRQQTVINLKTDHPWCGAPFPNAPLYPLHWPHWHLPRSLLRNL